MPLNKDSNKELVHYVLSVEDVDPSHKHIVGTQCVGVIVDDKGDASGENKLVDVVVFPQKITLGYAYDTFLVRDRQYSNKGEAGTWHWATEDVNYVPQQPEKLQPEVLSPAK